jgi:hypothetical protein
MRLSVKQEVLLEDGKREEERLGEVILDLSQFVGQKKEDARPRRYLLQDCKSNAVLRITVKMELLEGEASFVACVYDFPFSSPSSPFKSTIYSRLSAFTVHLFGLDNSLLPLTTQRVSRPPKTLP